MLKETRVFCELQGKLQWGALSISNQVTQPVLARSRAVTCPRG